MALDESFDFSRYYVLSSQFMPAPYRLEGGGPGAGSLMISSVGEPGELPAGECWRFTPLRNGTYRLTNEFLGSQYALGSFDGMDGCRMAPWVNSPGQQWVIVPETADYYRMYTLLTGPMHALESNDPEHGDENRLGIRGCVMTRYKLGDPRGNGQLWSLTPAKPIAIDADFDAMIPLDNDFTVTVQGAAFKNQPLKLLLDTGSAAFCVARSRLDMGAVRVLRENVPYPWDQKVQADLVEASVEVVTAAGTVVSALCWIFAAHEDDVTQLIGGFPTPGSLPYVLADTYPGLGASNEKDIGYGFVSTTGTDITTGWPTFTPYLMFTPQQSVLRHVEWSRPIPAYEPMRIPGLFSDEPITFAPHAVPGFDLTLELPDGADAPQQLRFDNLDATIDTGAPELVTRLGPDDPQRQAPFEQFFDRPGAPWGGDYNNHSSIAKPGCRVTVTWYDGRGVAYDYSYTTTTGAPRCTQFIVGDFDSGVPWTCDPPQMTRTRFSLGNTIYFFWPAYYYDLTNGRVGIVTRG